MKRIYVLLALTLTCAFTNAQIVQNGLVANFPLAGNADDISPVDIDGISNNVSPTTGYTGFSGTAMFFDPAQSSYIEAGTYNRNITTIVTLSAWIKTTLSSNQMIVDKYDFPSDQGYYIAITQGKALIAGRDGSGNFISAIGTSTVSDGQWHHIVGIIDGNTWQLQVDCEIENSVTTTTAAPDLTNANPLSIGRYYYGLSSSNPMYFSGRIDEIRIYNRVLTSAELDSLCNINEHLGAQDIDNDNFSIYPNPANEKVTIQHAATESASFGSIIIYNTLGEIVYRGKYSTEIDLGNLSKGVYYLNIYGRNEELLKKELLIKQ